MIPTLNIRSLQIVDSRKDFVLLARVAETSGRHDDMTVFARALTGSLGHAPRLTPEERDLLNSSYKAAIDKRLDLWRTLGSDQYAASAPSSSYRKQVANEIEHLCKEILLLLTDQLLPAIVGINAEEEVACLTMSGDFTARLAELNIGSQYALAAGEYYHRAVDLSHSKLTATHPLRLRAGLNCSIHRYDLLKDPKRAMELAKTTFDEAISKLDQLDEASYKESTAIMQSLRDKLLAWAG